MNENLAGLSETRMAVYMRILAELAPDTAELSKSFMTAIAGDFSCILRENQDMMPAIVRQSCQCQEFGKKRWD